MKISHYTLKFNNSDLRGVLLEEGGAYSLIQPWTSLGDASLEEHLEDLKTKRALPLTRRTLELLEKEKKAKADGVSLIPKQSPSSHLLISSATEIEKEVAAGVKTFKVKIGKNIDADLQLLKNIEAKMENTFRLRLDANLSFSSETADKFFSALSEKLLCAIDFVEDPIKGTPEEWLDFSTKFNLMIAHDFAPEAFRTTAEVWVLKPSRQNPWSYVERAAYDMRRIVVTSALDHPLGHVIAAIEAQAIAEEHPLLIDDCGLISFESLSVKAPFSRKGAHLDFSGLSELGYGMDAEMKKLQWVDL